MISSLADLEKAFPDKDFREYYVMYHWIRGSRAFERKQETITFYAPGNKNCEHYEIPLEKFLKFQNNGVFFSR